MLTAHFWRRAAGGLFTAAGRGYRADHLGAGWSGRRRRGQMVELISTAHALGRRFLDFSSILFAVSPATTFVGRRVVNIQASLVTSANVKPS
jgi:hypothetical protein